ncbi:MAG: hypothetical protein PHC66_03565 [Candidatus Nanoarchaeia archaeon]|nr:hypothetical protein [Candidatus Nanoarchaeia archaeon]MDD5239814.1 hypothetical protein [Candidatus Nanoarchaeia archaeon]
MFGISEENVKRLSESEEMGFLDFEEDYIISAIRTDKNNIMIGGFCECFMGRYHSLKGDSAAQKYLIDTVLSQFYFEMLEQGLPEYEHEIPDDGTYLDINLIRYGSKKAAKTKPYKPPRVKRPKKEKEAFPLEATAKRFSYLMERILESAHLPENYKGYMELITGKPQRGIYQYKLDDFLDEGAT